METAHRTSRQRLAWVRAGDEYWSRFHGVNERIDLRVGPPLSLSPRPRPPAVTGPEEASFRRTAPPPVRGSVRTRLGGLRSTRRNLHERDADGTDSLPAPDRRAVVAATGTRAARHRVDPPSSVARAIVGAVTTLATWPPAWTGMWIAEDSKTVTIEHGSDHPCVSVAPGPKAPPYRSAELLGGGTKSIDRLAGTCWIDDEGRFYLEVEAGTDGLGPATGCTQLRSTANPSSGRARALIHDTLCSYRSPESASTTTMRTISECRGLTRWNRCGGLLDEVPLTAGYGSGDKPSPVMRRGASGWYGIVRVGPPTRTATACRFTRTPVDCSPSEPHRARTP